MFVATVSLIALIVTVYLVRRAIVTARAAGSSVPRAAIGWVVPLVAAQAFVAVYAAMGLVENDIASGLAFNIVLTGCAWASVNRTALSERLHAWVGPKGRFPHPLIASVLLMLVAGFGATLALEVPSNHVIWGMYPLCLLLEWGIITALMCGAFFIFQRRAVPPVVIAFVVYFIGVAQFFIITFKSMPITPGDLSALSTAAAVAGNGYTYSLSAYCLYGYAFLALTMLLCQMAALLRPARDGRSRLRLIVNLAVGIACVAGVGAHVTLLDYYNTLYIQVYTWRPLNSYYTQGFLPCFISGAQTIKPPRPEGYTMDGAQELIDTYAAAYDEGAGASEGRAQAAAQFDEEKPAVVVIMNETFSDLSIYQNLHAGYEGPQFFKSLPDALARGRLYVSAFGGGTCNSEFEFLTGNSMAFLGSGVYPYTIYDLTETENLVSQFKKMGYTATAMHPNHATNWNRENVYRDFGFDDFLAIEDFQGAEQMRGMVTDRATYNKILELLDGNDDPQFIFDVTMQNHSGYNTGLIPYDKRTNYLIDGQPDAEVNEYLALIDESDRALQEFIGKLRTLDRKVVVVFFGDHQPYFPDTLNDQWFTGEDEAAHAERLWQTDYIIWANYDVAGRDQSSTVDDLSTNYLGSVLMDLIGAPMSDYQKAHISLRSALPAINATGYEDKSLQWFLSSAASDPDAFAPGSAAREATDARADLAKMQYLMLFQDGENIYTKSYQSAANQTDPNAQPA